jgi:hypothetical protein
MLALKKAINRLFNYRPLAAADLRILRAFVSFVKKRFPPDLELSRADRASQMITLESSAMRAALDARASGSESS